MQLACSTKSNNSVAVKIVIITGQTATGKTKLAVEIAKKYNGTLINFDSRHIYKYLDIVSGKDLESVKDVEFLLHSFLDPKEHFSSFEYQQKALRLIEVHKKKKVLVFVGGAYLYIYNLLYGLDSAVEPDWKLRRELEKKTIQELQTTLKKLSVQSFKRLNNSDRSNPRRLMRKIEQAEQGIEVSADLKFEFTQFFKQFDIEFIGLKHKGNDLLRSRIKKRVEERLKKGAIEEVQELLDQGYKDTYPGLQTIGYQQIIKHLNGELTLEDVMSEWVTKEVRYAKRQLTFMKRDPHIAWRET